MLRCRYLGDRSFCILSFSLSTQFAEGWGVIRPAQILFQRGSVISRRAGELEACARRRRQSEFHVI